MAIPIINFWKNYFSDIHEGLGSSYERVILNDRLLQFCKLFRVESVLEAPIFGFTGLSGINSMELARTGKQVRLLDHDVERIELIKKVWADSNLPVEIQYTNDYRKLPYESNSVDMTWNFSALWFVKDLETFLSEVTRVTKTVIVICVPNQTGIGYLSQKWQGKKELERLLNAKNIRDDVFVPIMQKQGWRLLMDELIDCPPWPDIGMAKEDFLGKFGASKLVKPRVKDSESTLSILNYYHGNDESFPERMRRYNWLESYAPTMLKRIWAHHHYYLFVKQ